jgi:hypothetical protein
VVGTFDDNTGVHGPLVVNDSKFTTYDSTNFDYRDVGAFVLAWSTLSRRPISDPQQKRGVHRSAPGWHSGGASNAQTVPV